MIKPRTPRGVLELLPSEQVAFDRMLHVVRDSFERFGFLPISTPIIEISEVLRRKVGSDTEGQILLVQSSGAAAQNRPHELALRFDLTVPLARYVAEHEKELQFPFRRYQIEAVFRGERPQAGRYREFIQCDIDIVDQNQLSIRHDAEIPAVIDAVFSRLRIGDYTIRISNRRLLRGLLEHLGVLQTEDQLGILRELDKLERDGRAAVAHNLSKVGLSSSATGKLLDWTGNGPLTGDEALSVIGQLSLMHPEVDRGARELETVIGLLKLQGMAQSVWALDLSIARGLDYYTGTVYETRLNLHPGVGSIASGGRYDDLASAFTKSRLPGVGMSIGFTRLFWQLRQLNLVSGIASSVQVLVTLIDDAIDHVLGLAATLRNADINTEVTMEPRSLSRQLKYADRAQIPIVVIAGADERQRGTVQVRNLFTQVQQEVAASDLTATVSSLL